MPPRPLHSLSSLHRGGLLFTGRIDRSSRGPLRAAYHRRSRRVNPRIRPLSYRFGRPYLVLLSGLWHRRWCGGACCYLPTLAIIGGWFVRHRNTALGIAAAGTGCGTMVLPPLAAALIQRYGWRGTNIIFGLAAGVVLFGCAIAVKSPPIARSTSGPDVCSGIPFAHVNLFCSTSRGCWQPRCSARLYFCLRSPAIIGASEVAAAALVSVIGGASIIGRLVLGPIGDRLGVLPLFKLTVLMMAISYAIWLFSSSYDSLMIFAVVLGIGYGSRISAVPGVLIEYFGLQNVGTLLGVFFTASGLSALLGPLLAGLAVDLTASYSGGDYLCARDRASRLYCDRFASS